MKSFQQASILAVVVAALGHGAAVRAESVWTPTNTHAHPITNATMVGNLAPTESVDVVVTLKPRNRAQLDSLVVGLTKPGSSTFRQYLTHEEVLAQFAPTQQQAHTVANYLSLMGFTDVQIADNRMLVRAKGTADAVKRSFNTTLAHFSRNGQDAIANITDAQVPSQLQDTVQAVLGLQTIDHAHVTLVTPHDPLQFLTIYDAAALPQAMNTNVYTTVGIFTVGSVTQTIADLHTFESQNRLPTINPTVVTVGGTSTDTSGTVEWDMDSQDIQAMGGGFVSMIFYDSVGWSDAQMAATLNKIVSDDLAKVINVSIEDCEIYPHADGAMASDDVTFEMAIAQGQTFSVASGDWGSKECGSGVNGYSFGTVAGESYPASSPYVIAVGGTTLSTNTNNTYGGETGWTFSGGGPSLYEPQPSWQAGIVPGTTRAVPDIAFDADPNSGAEFIAAGVSTINGGTSLASPLFVGSWARMESAHGNNLGFPAAWFYQHASQDSSSMFHDVTSGSNGDYSAGVGYDYVTGLGSLDVGGVNAYVSQGVLATDMDSINNQLTAYYVGEDMNLYQDLERWANSATQVTGIANRPPVAPGSGIATYVNTIYDAPEVFYLTSGAQGTQNVEQLWGTGNSPTNMNVLITNSHPAQPATPAFPGSKLVGFIDSCAQTDNVFYVGTDHHVHLMTWAPAPGWTTEDLTGLTGTGNVLGTMLMGHIKGVAEEVFYIESDNHVHELWRWSNCSNGPGFDGWHNQDVNNANSNGAPNAAAGSPLAGFYDSAAGSDAVFYIDSSGDLRELYLSPQWIWSNIQLTGTIGAAVPVRDSSLDAADPGTGSALAAHVNTLTGTEEVFYLGSNNNVFLVTASSATPTIWWNGALAGALNVQAGCPAAAAGSPLVTDINTQTNSDELYYISSGEQLYQLWPANGGWGCVGVTHESEPANP